MGLDKRSQVSLTFGTYIKPYIRLNISCKYYDFGLNSNRKMNVSRFFPLGIKFDLAIK